MEASIWWHYQVFFQNLTFGDRVFQNHRRSDLAKPRQTDTARSCLHWNNQWCCKQFSEQHCLEPFFLKAIMRVCFLCHHLDIWRWGVVEPLEGVTLPSRIRQTPNQVSRSDLLFNHQWFWKPFSNQQWLDFFGKHFIRHCVWCHHQRIFQVWQLATGLQKPMGRSDSQTTSKRQFPQLFRGSVLWHDQTIFKLWHLARGSSKTIWRSDLAKPRQTDTARSCPP